MDITIIIRHVFTNKPFTGNKLVSGLFPCAEGAEGKVHSCILTFLAGLCSLADYIAVLLKFKQ